MPQDPDRDVGRQRDLPLLPLRDIIVFPHMVVPLFVGREKSIRALEDAMRGSKEIVLSAQKRAKTNDPRPDDVFNVGTVGIIIQMLRLPDGTVKVLVEGRRRARIISFLEMDPSFRVRIEEVHEPTEHNQEIEDVMRTVRGTFETYVRLNKRIPPEMIASVAAIDDPARLGDTIVAHLSLKLNDKQRILETEEPVERLERLFELMQAEIEILQVERKIRSRTKKGNERKPNEFYLNDQMQQIQKELGGERDEFKNEIEELEERIRKKKVSREADDRLKRELKKLKMMSPMSAEATVVRNYIDWILSLPWYDKTEEVVDIEMAEQVLSEDHYGLDKPKERIVEYLAVHKLVEKMRGPVLCLVGPPGVGKTSLARSIARATNRKFARLSLGGVRDEAEVRGHRRTYIGALPGKIVQSLKKIGSNNPVMLLDEIDKMSTDFRGDPSSALLEVLDPEQNATFNDHYLDLDYDLSEVMFITTANNASQIPAPLRDRMEVIEIPGYTEIEKLNIARKHLVPKCLTDNGLAEVEVEFSDAGLSTIINHYTREAGVRSLEREISSVCRKVARDWVKRQGESPRYKLGPKQIVAYLGPWKFQDDKTEDSDQIGLTNGLAWTMYGGVLLTAEVSVMPGAGKLIITGKLGDVMQESAQAAMSYVRSRAINLGLTPDFYQKVDLHVHFPEGAAPKDGPSAGITMVTSLVSALTRIPVRRDVAMTGEITLRGRILPIGGLKEKILAAHRAGVKRVVIPRENEKDIRDIPAAVRKAVEIFPVSHMDEVLGLALQLDDPAAFLERLRKPILPPNVIAAEKDAQAVMAAALVPPSPVSH
jgi:ATP-dependent Lon protease